MFCRGKSIRVQHHVINQSTSEKSRVALSTFIAKCHKPHRYIVRRLLSAVITSDPNILPSFKQTQDSLILSYGAFIGLNGPTSGPSSQIARAGKTGAVEVFVLTFRLMLSSKAARHHQKGFVFEHASSSQCGSETSEEVECTSSPKACAL